jgi:hypothetical protein
MSKENVNSVKKTIFQKLGCLEALPTVIFLLIQIYSNRKDYFRLMCSSLSAFRSTKYETACYALKLSKTLDENSLKRLSEITNRVKDKSKQIAVTLCEMDQSSITKTTQVCEWIEKLSIHKTCPILTIDFSFGIFNNILHLSLKNIEGIIRANLCLEKTIKLELHKCSFQEIIGWNSKTILKELIIFDCPSLLTLPPFDNISVVTIRCLRNHHEDFMPNPINFEGFGSPSKFSFEGVPLTLDTFQLMALPSFVSLLQELRIKTSFSSDFQDFSFCQNIPLVQIHNVNLTLLRHVAPLLPVYHGKNIKLEQCKLSRWMGQSLPNVVKCDLTLCYELTGLPLMPKLIRLKMDNCYELSEIPLFPSLTYLSVVSCRKLSQIAFCPKLLTVVLRSLQSFEDASTIALVRHFHIQSCDRIVSIPSLKNAEEVTIYNCHGLTNLDEMTLDWKMEENRNVWLSSLNGLSVFTFCQNIYYLELTNLRELRSCDGIGNIQKLTLKKCTNLMCTKGLGVIIERINLLECPLLRDIDEVNDIPVVDILSSPNIDFHGLGNHHAVGVRGCPFFDKLLEEYQKEQKNGEIFKAIKQLHWNASGSLPAVQIW